MGKPLFDVPNSIEEVLQLSMADATNLSLVNKEGLVAGFYAIEDGVTHLRSNGLFRVFGGDQLLFSTESRAEVNAYIYGVFLNTFAGRSMKDIREEIVELDSLVEQGEDISKELNRFTSESSFIAFDCFPGASGVLVKEKDDRVEIFVGNTKVFITDTGGEAKAFLCGYSPLAS